MPSHIRRTLAVALVIALPSAGCFSPHYQRLERGTSLDDASAIMTRSGLEMQFAVDGATIRNDTLYAKGTAGTLVVPTDSVARIARRGFSPGRTAALVVGIAAGALAIFVVLAAGSFGGN
jgi:hypothetical protein